MRRRIFQKILFSLIALFLFFSFLIILLEFIIPSKQDITFGVTFSPSYATYLGLDWKEIFQASLDELKVRHFRIPVYWSSIEPSQGKFIWDDLDWMIEQADASGAKIFLAIGRKVPRWPECYTPDWAKNLSTDEQEQALLFMLEQVIERYQSHPSIEQWQVENEPFLNYGECPSPNHNLLQKEISTVRKLDNRPIILTVSGELEPWNRSIRHADILGISIYRQVYRQGIGYFSYPIPASFYRLRSMILSAIYNRPIIVSELQMEPWFFKSFDQFSLEERRKLFTVSEFEKRIEYVQRTGFSQVYLWGVEWWYAEKKWQDESLWNYAKTLFP